MYVGMYIWLILIIAEYGSTAGKVANSNRGWMNRENKYILSPFAPENLVS